jgi:hypothetical protein
VLENSAPPAGNVRPDPRAEGRGAQLPAVPFVGWLGLMRALADALEDPPERSVGGR